MDKTVILSIKAIFNPDGETDLSEKVECFRGDLSVICYQSFR